MTDLDQKPRLRFKGFTEAWEQRKLGDIGKTFTGLSGKTSDDFGHGDAKFLPYLNIFNNPIADINFLESTEIDKSQNEIKYGDVFFTTSSETPEEVGMSSVWLGNSENIYLNSFCFGFRPLIDFNPYYFGYLLRSDTFRNPVTILAQGISRFNISKNKVMEIEIPLPAKQEQEKIGQLFYKLDSLITLHQSKYEKLKSMKTALLEKMFPARNDTSPKIRFKGFTEAWEQRKVNDLMDVGSVKRIHQSDWTQSGIRFLRARDIVANHNGENVEDPLFISKEKYDEYSLISGKVKKGDLLVTGVGTIGIPMLISNEKPIYFKDGNVIWLKNNNSTDGKFLFFSYDSKTVKSFISDEAGIGTVGTYTIDSCKRTPLNLPNIEEQKKIGTLFEQLDSLITLHQRKCEKLKNLKKSLLERMFI